jgi:Fe-S oxidoreductase
MPGRTALLHGHCHQKAFATVGAAVETLRLIPELQVETFDSTCCGMAGAFGYEAEHHEMSLAIGELSVLPRLRAAPPDTLLAACGTSCRHQIADALGRDARHTVRLLDDASTPRAGASASPAPSAGRQQNRRIGSNRPPFLR